MILKYLRSKVLISKKIMSLGIYVQCIWPIFSFIIKNMPTLENLKIFKVSMTDMPKWQHCKILQDTWEFQTYLYLLWIHVPWRNWKMISRKTWKEISFQQFLPLMMWNKPSLRFIPSTNLRKKQICLISSTWWALLRPWRKTLQKK